VFLPYQPETKTNDHTEDEGQSELGAVLVAEDSGAARPQIADQLARYGYRVVEASTVEQTLAVAHDGVAAIVLDTTLDGMNGWEILPLLRRAKPEAHTPIVLMSRRVPWSCPRRPRDFWKNQPTTPW
jgi:CheY-like chemotaxis protein